MPVIKDNYPYISDFHDDEVYVFSTLGKGPKGDQGEKGDVTFPTFADPIEWSKETDYPQYTIVLYEGASYIAKINVPHGVNITNAHYWQLTNNYNAQVEQLRLTFEAAINTLNLVTQPEDPAFTVTAQYMKLGRVVVCTGRLVCNSPVPANTKLTENLPQNIGGRQFAIVAIDVDTNAQKLLKFNNTAMYTVDETVGVNDFTFAYISAS